MNAKSLMLLLFMNLSPNIMAAIALNKIPPRIQLHGDSGGKVDVNASGFDSLLELRGKLAILFYVAPSARNDNKAAENALEKADFPSEKIISFGVVNMAASWLPDGILASFISSNQKKHPKTVFVKDTDRAFVKLWKLEDNASNIVVTDKKGKVVFFHKGVLPEKAISAMIEAIKKHI